MKFIWFSPHKSKYPLYIIQGVNNKGAEQTAHEDIWFWKHIFDKRTEFLI